MINEIGEGRLRAIRLIALAVALVLLAVGGYLLLMRDRLQYTLNGPPEKITIAFSTLPYAALAQIAQVRGFYRQEGLDVTPQLHSHGKLALEAVLAGKADFATVAETPIMLAAMNGGDLSILATIHVSKKNHAIVARKDRGIVAPGDLKGRRIGATLGTSGDFYLDAFLLAREIPRKDVEVVDLKPQEIAPAFMKGDVDAVAAWAPFLMQTQKEAGELGVSFYDDDIYMLMFNVVSTREYAAKNRERVRKMLRALLRAEEFALRNPTEAQRLVADFNDIDPVTMEQIWSFSTFRVTLDQALVLALEDESRWAIQNRLTSRKTIPNYLDFIHLDALHSVKPAAVGILR